jgi:hypothetical protein
VETEQLLLPADHSEPEFEGVPTATLRALSSQYRRLYLLRSPDHGAFVVRLPSGGETARAFEQMGDPQTRFAAFKGLASLCVVYPDKPVLAELFEDYAGLPAALGRDIASLSGLGAELDAKKLARG